MTTLPCGKKPRTPNENVDPAPCGGALACRHPGEPTFSNTCWKACPYPRQMVVYNGRAGMRKKKKKHENANLFHKVASG